MKKVQQNCNRMLVTMVVCFFAFQYVIIWYTPVDVLMSNNGLIVFLLPCGLAIVRWAVWMRLLSRRLYDADLMLCPSCEYDLRSSATTVCPKCAAANSVTEDKPVHTCSQCASTLPISREFKCPECGTAYSPQGVQDEWIKWLRKRSPLGPFARIERPRRRAV